MITSKLTRRLHKECIGKSADDVITSMMDILAHTLTAFPPKERDATVAMLQAFLTAIQDGSINELKSVEH